MSCERNTETLNGLKSGLKALQSQCIDTFNIIENSPSDNQFGTPEVVSEKSVAYIEGLRIEVENLNTPILTDDNLLTTQFLLDLKSKTLEVKELVAFTRGTIHDIDSEIDRLTTLVKTSQEAKSRPKVQKQEVTAEHIQKARERFHMMKNELHSLIQSLFPGNFETIREILGNLMMEKLNETSSGYITITSENYQLVELLKDINLVIANPYNNMEVKLAY